MGRSKQSKLPEEVEISWSTGRRFRSPKWAERRQSQFVGLQDGQSALPVQLSGAEKAHAEVGSSDAAVWVIPSPVCSPSPILQQIKLIDLPSWSLVVAILWFVAGFLSVVNWDLFIIPRNSDTQATFISASRLELTN